MSLNSGASPAKFPPPLLPLKGPALVALSSPGWRHNHVFTRDSNSMGDLSRATKTYTTHKDADKAQRTPSKVRFSFDDHNINNQRLPRHNPSGHQQLANGQLPRNPLIREQRAIDQRMKPILDSSSLFPGNNTPLPLHPTSRQHILGRQINRSAPGESRPPNTFLSREALLTHNNQLEPNFSQQADPGSKHSFIPHHNPQQQPYNPLMSSLNISTDEDDDVLSTTTSGSYAIDDVVSTPADS